MSEAIETKELQKAISKIDDLSTKKHKPSRCSKMKCKCIIAVVVIVLLLASIACLFKQYSNQAKLINEQNECISRLTQNGAEFTSKYGNIDQRINTLFDNMNTIFKSPIWDTDSELLSSRTSRNFHNNNHHLHYSHVGTSVTEKEYVITIMLPGFSKDQVAIDITDSTLKIHAKMDPSIKSHNSNDTKYEFQRAIKLPNDTDYDNVKSLLENGVLTVYLPRIDIVETPSKKILVE